MTVNLDKQTFSAHVTENYYNPTHQDSSWWHPSNSFCFLQSRQSPHRLIFFQHSCFCLNSQFYQCKCLTIVLSKFIHQWQIIWIPRVSYTNWRNQIIKCGFLPNILPITKLLPWNLTYSHVVLFGHTGTSGQYPHVFSPHLMITLVPIFILSHVSSVHSPISQISYAFEKRPTSLVSCSFIWTLDTCKSLTSWGLNRSNSVVCPATMYIGWTLRLVKHSNLLQVKSLLYT